MYLILIYWYTTSWKILGPLWSYCNKIILKYWFLFKVIWYLTLKFEKYQYLETHLPTRLYSVNSDNWKQKWWLLTISLLIEAKVSCSCKKMSIKYKWLPTSWSNILSLVWIFSFLIFSLCKPFQYFFPLKIKLSSTHDICLTLFKIKTHYFQIWDLYINRTFSFFQKRNFFQSSSLEINC